MLKKTLIAALALAGAVAVATAQPDEKVKGDPNAPPPEQTEVSARLMMDADKGAEGGVAYFIFQKRLMEIPHENSMEKVKAMSEVGVAVDKDGSFTLNMAPGNYAIVYDPKGEAKAEALQPGPESMAIARRITPDKLKERMEIIRANAQKGMPIKDGKLGDAYVIENRFIRPPVSDFGEILLGEKHSVTVLAEGDDGKPLDFPVSLRLRGRNGDISEPHPPSVSAPGTFIFNDIMPQIYSVFALGTKPKPGAGDEVTTPSIENAMFVFDGQPYEHKVKVVPGKPGGEDDTPPPTPKEATKD